MAEHPGEGARPGSTELHSGSHAEEKKTVWHPASGVHDISCAVTRWSPPLSPLATSGYPLPTLRVDQSGAAAREVAISLRLRGYSRILHLPPYSAVPFRPIWVLL
jgi:hypothetical protein